VLRGYRRSWLNGDLVAGGTVTAYLIPQVMAYATLAGLPAFTGLWGASRPGNLRNARLVAVPVDGPGGHDRADDRRRDRATGRWPLQDFQVATRVDLADTLAVVTPAAALIVVGWLVHLAPMGAGWPPGTQHGWRPGPPEPSAVRPAQNGTEASDEVPDPELPEDGDAVMRVAIFACADSGRSRSFSAAKANKGC
jgi:Sulfate permease family